MFKKTKKLTRTEKRLLKEWMERNNEIGYVFDLFNPNGTAAHFEFPAISGDALDDLYKVGIADIKGEPGDGQKQVRELMKQKYNELHRNAKKGKPGNIEVRLDKGTVYSADGKYKIGNAVALIGRNDDTRYVFFKAGDRFDARIIIGGDPIDAYIAFRAKEEDRDGEEDIVMVSLHEFRLFGICDKAKPGEEDGVMVSYGYCDTEVVCYHIESFEFGQGQLLADWLQGEWAKAKEDKEKHSKNGMGDEARKA